MKNKNNIVNLLKGKSILISGGTGSFGTAMLQTLLKIADPKKL